MEVNCFQILLIDVIFYLQHGYKVVLDVLIKKYPNIYCLNCLHYKIHQDNLYYVSHSAHWLSVMDSWINEWMNEWMNEYMDE